MWGLIAYFGSIVIALAILVIAIRQKLAKRGTQDSGTSIARRGKGKRAAEAAAASPEAEASAPAGRRRIISPATVLASAPEAEIEPAALQALPAIPGSDPIEQASSPARAILARAARQAIVFRQIFPPSLAPNSLSFFGGAPRAQAPFDWPHAAGPDGARHPLHFVLQVDLAAIPTEAGLGILPDDGVLHVFLGLDGITDGCRVIYQPASASGVWRDIEPPADLGPVYGEQAGHLWPWALEAAHGPLVLPFWPFDPVAVALSTPQSDLPASGDATGAETAWADRAVGEALLAAQGAEVPVSPFTIQDFAGPDGTMVQPFPGFPHDWLAVQVCSAMLIHEIERTLRHPRPVLYPALGLDDMIDHLHHVRAEAHDWFDRALAHPAFEGVPQDDAGAFWKWFSSHSPLTELLAPRALTAALETSLHAAPESAARIPSGIIGRLHHRHALAVRTDGGVHATSPDRMLAPPADIPGDDAAHARTHLLLLELSTDEAIGHCFGESTYQFWITPNDLADRRFDQVLLTKAAY